MARAWRVRPVFAFGVILIQSISAMKRCFCIALRCRSGRVRVYLCYMTGKIMKSAQPGKMLMMTFTLSLSSCEYYSAWAPSEITNTADKAQVGVCEDWILGRSVIPMVVIWHNQQPCHWSEMQNQNESKWYMIYDFIYIIIYILWSFNNDQKKDDSRLHQAADSTKASIFSRCKVRFWPPSRKYVSSRVS